MPNIPVQQILLDLENPRYEITGSQLDALQAIVEDQQDKLVRLAADIVEHWLDPSMQIMVMRAEDEDTEVYTVLEGNRRIAALKLLANPDLLDGFTVKSPYKKRFVKLSQDFQEKSYGDPSCVIMSSREEAEPWIELRHTGENEGVGLVSWDSDQSTRFKSRSGKKPLHQQTIDYLIEIGAITKTQAKQIAITNFQRLIGDKEVRSRLGLDRVNGELSTSYPPEEAIKPLTRIALDLAEGKINVNHIRNQEDRLKYIDSLDAKDLPDTDKQLLEPVSLITNKDADEPEAKKTPQKTKKKTSGKSKNRKSVIPRNYSLEIGSNRAHEIFKELRKLNADEFTNAAAVLLRVFIEVSLDHYLEKRSIKIDERSKLTKKLEGVLRDAKSEEVLTEQQAQPLDVATSNPRSIFAIRTFNAYVHNKDFIPNANDLRHAWDTYEPLIAYIWS